MNASDCTLTTTSTELASSSVPRSVPGRDLVEFHGLCARNQERITRLIAAFEIIERAASKMGGYAQAAAACTGRGFTGASLRRAYGAYRASGSDWRALIDRAMEAKPISGMPLAFIEEIQRRVDANGRSAEIAIKLLRADSTQGRTVPGYGTWRDWWQATKPHLPVPAVCPGYPHGWTVRNLMRKLDSSKARRAAQTNGTAAATAHKPLVYTTRAALYPGAVYQFDDLWHDFFVASTSTGQVGRPLEFFAHDLFSARKICFGMRVRTKEQETMKGINGQMVREIIAATFASCGYSPRGTIIYAEHGTTGISKEIMEILSRASGGLINLKESGMQGAAAHAGQYPGITRGNPRHKASLESSNNLVHNLTAGLPGQTGPTYQRQPDQTDGMKKYNETVLAARQQMPPDVAELLEFSLLTEVQAMRVVGGLYRVLENDTEHNLEGWQEASNVLAEVQLMGAWFNQHQLAELPADEQQLIFAKLQNGTAITRTRKMSRLEAWQRGSGELIKITGGALCELLGPECTRERKITRHLFEFEDARLGEGKVRFESVCITPDGRELLLTDGQAYLTTCNPLKADELLVRDLAGRFIGTCPRLHKAMQADAESIARAMGRAAHQDKLIMEPLRLRQLGAARERERLHAHNAETVQRHQEQEAAGTANALAALAGAAQQDTFQHTAGDQDTPHHTTTPHECTTETADW